MSHKDNVKRWYAAFNANWYDFFRGVWINLVSKKAEEQFISLLQKHVKPDSEILDLGCGTGINLGRVQQLNLRFKRYTGADFSAEMLSIAAEKYGQVKNASFIKRDITQKPKNKKYNVIISTWVLSHLPRPSKVVNAYYTHLSDDGVMLIVFLTKPRWYIHFWFHPFVRLFAAKYVSNDEISKIDGEKTISVYSSGMATLLQIRKAQSR